MVNLVKSFYKKNLVIGPEKAKKFITLYILSELFIKLISARLHSPVAETDKEFREPDIMLSSKVTLLLLMLRIAEPPLSVYIFKLESVK